MDGYTKNIAFIAMDSTHSSESTVIEYPNYLVVIELPFIDEGGGKRTGLNEDAAKAERFIAFLKKKYSNKPVKYVLSSHWHLHSLSGITPFFKQGTKLITTKSNWDYGVKNGLLGAQSPSLFSPNLIYVRRDTTLLAKSEFPIKALYLDSTYKNKPTDDYLFFYLPRTKTMLASCMCAVSDVDYSKLKDYAYSDRLIDLERAISSRKLPVEKITKLSRIKQMGSEYIPPVYSYSFLQELMKNGKTMQQYVREYTSLNQQTLIHQKDSLIHTLIAKKLSPQIINQAVYTCIREKEFKKAVALSQLLNTYYPGELNFIDTMGEAYFAAGNTSAAAFYNGLLLQKDPKFGGGLKAWEQNKKTNTY